MTIKELKEKLNEYPEDTKVLIFDADMAELYTITGFLYDSNNQTLELCSDDQEG